MEFTGPLLDLIQIGLLLATCYACKCYGYKKGIEDTVEFFSQNDTVIEIKKDT
jgi:hypothetical protein